MNSHTLQFKMLVANWYSRIYRYQEHNKWISQTLNLNAEAMNVDILYSYNSKMHSKDKSNLAAIKTHRKVNKCSYVNQDMKYHQ